MADLYRRRGISEADHYYCNICVMLIALDLFFTIVHLGIIGFNLLGWIWRKTRRLHLIILLITAASWLILGIWYGIGYCPFTDWQWQIKKELGEWPLPDSFIKYFLDKILETNLAPGIVNLWTAIIFVLLVVIAMFGNLRRIRPRRP